jgi:hypothetical protein
MRTEFGAFEGHYAAYWTYLHLTLQNTEQALSWEQHYNVLRAYYLNNGLYESLDRALTGTLGVDATIKPLRNPAFRIVEFYAAKLWPGALPAALPVVTENTACVAAIEQIWQWSNWAAEKETASRWFATYGDMFLKVATRTDEAGRVRRVFLQNLQPQTVTEIRTDERGFLTYVRLDVPRRRETTSEAEGQPYLYTEVWTKDSMRAWEHVLTPATPLARLGNPLTETPLSAFGIDFIPIVYQSIRPTGGERGNSAFMPSLDKIDEANRVATRLHQMLFRHNKPLWMLSGAGNDTSGRPLPPPRLGTGSAAVADALELDDDSVISVGGSGTLTALVPPIDYASALATLQNQLDEIGADNPELAYYALRDRQGDVSGRALERMLGDAVDRLLGARTLAEDALRRAHAMAFTIGQAAGLFQDLGSYDNGDFEHTFAERAVFPATDLEDAQTVQAWVSVGVPLATALKRIGWSEDQIREAAKDATLLPLPPAQLKTQREAAVLAHDLGVSKSTLMEEMGYDPEAEEAKREEEAETALTAVQNAMQSPMGVGNGADDEQEQGDPNAE